MTSKETGSLMDTAQNKNLMRQSGQLGYQSTADDIVRRIGTLCP